MPTSIRETNRDILDNNTSTATERTVLTMADSIREALTSAFADAPKEETNSIPDSTPDAAVASPASREGEADVVHSAPIEGDAKPTVAESTAAAPRPESGSPPQSPQAAASDPAPASWKAEEKAEWATLSAKAKEAVKRREADMQRAFNTSTDARKFRDDFQRAVEPHTALLQKHNVQNVLAEVVAPILEIRSILEQGTPEQKAHAVHNMIKSFNVDVATLDGMLVNGPPANSAPPAPKFDPHAVPEFAPLFEMAQQMQAMKEQQAEAAIAEVATLPHFDEVREDMADILESFSKRGKEISLTDAHRRAVAMRPDLELAAPAPAQITTSEAAAILARSRNAASTVAGAPKSTPGAKPTTLRAQIESAMNER
jgi:hypothetical protein